MLHRSAFCVLLSSVLWLSLTTASVTTTLTVNLRSTEAGTDGTLTVPRVCNVTFQLPDEYTSMDQRCSLVNNSCTVDVTGDDDNLTMTFERESDSQSISFVISFDSAMNVSCSEYIPHAELSELQKTLFTCYPLYACGASSTATPNEIVWRKFFDFDTLTEFIASPEGNSSEYDNYTLQDTDGETYYPPKNISGQTKRTRISIWDGGHVLNVSSSNADPPGPEALGYYIPTVVLSDNRTVKGSYSVVFLDPTIERRSDQNGNGIKVIQGTGEGRDFKRIYCVFRSFPPATVTWDAPSRSNFELRNNTGDSSDDFVDLDLTYFSHLFFKEIQYDDAGKYRCRGDNGISSTKPTHTSTLRVRNRLRPLWPALGIVGSFVITAMFIFGGTLVDKCRGKQTADDDEGSFKRNYSVVSNMGEDNSNNNNADTRRAHRAAKRLSSATQELLPNAL